MDIDGKSQDKDMLAVKVVLVYDRVDFSMSISQVPEDLGAEYEDGPAIEGLLEAIESHGHEAIGLVWDNHFVERICDLAPDLVFNIVEGVRGPSRESLVPAWLDHLGIPYTGSDGLTLGLTLDKARSKEIALAHGVHTPGFKRVCRMDQIDTLNLEYPLFVKPNAEGSSMGIRHTSRVETFEELERQVRWVLKTYEQDCLVEEFAPGREFCVAILGNQDPQVMPIAEIRSPADFYSYEEKSRHLKKLECPADISEKMADELKEIGSRLFHMFRCRDFARVDLRIDRNGQASFLEINPLPSLDLNHASFPQQALAAQLDYTTLIGRIIEHALSRMKKSNDMATACLSRNLGDEEL